MGSSIKYLLYVNLTSVLWGKEVGALDLLVWRGVYFNQNDEVLVDFVPIDGIFILFQFICFYVDTVTPYFQRFEVWSFWYIVVDVNVSIALVSVVYSVDVHELWFIFLNHVAVVQHCVMRVNVKHFIILVGEAVADSFLKGS